MLAHALTHEPPTPTGTHVSIDEALTRSVGEFGWGQRRWYILASLAWVPVGMQTMLFLYAGQDPVGQRMWYCVNPKDAECRAAYDDLSHPNAFCLLPHESWEWRSRGASYAAEWGMVCGQRWQVTLVDILFFLGCAAGIVAANVLSERIGHRRALFCSTVLAGFSGILAAAAPTLWWYCVSRCLTGVGTAAMGACAFVLGTDCIGPSWRGMASLTTQCFFAVGACVVTLLSLLLPHWRVLSLACALSSACSVLLWTQLPESPRWLLRQGLKGEATSALAAIASANRTRMPEQPLSDPPPASKPLGEVLLHGRLRRRFFAMLLAWAAVTASYYGGALALAALPSGGVRLQFAELPAFAVELPSIAVAAAMTGRIGRRMTLLTMLLGGGGLNVGAALAGQWARRLALTAGRCFTVAGLAVMPLYAIELFPTSVRNQVMSTLTALSYLSPTLAPGMQLLAASAGLPWLPLLVYGCLLLMVSVTMLLVPETLGAPLPETTQDLATPTAVAVVRRQSPHHYFWKRLFRSRGSSNGAMQFIPLWNTEPDSE